MQGKPARVLLLLFLHLFLLNWYVDAGTMQFDVRLHCEHRHDVWCADFYIYEQDVPTHHDILHHLKACTRASSMTYKTFVVDGGVDGLSFRYEIMYTLHHNCTDPKLPERKEPYCLCNVPDDAKSIPIENNDRMIVMEIPVADGTRDSKKHACIIPNDYRCKCVKHCDWSDASFLV